MNKHTKRITTYGLLIGLALVFSYIEFLIPISFAVPGIKLGLGNIVVVVALYKMDYKSAFIIDVVRIILVGLLFYNGASFMYSLAGGLLSFIIMALLKRSDKFALVTVSICGGIFHNVGQILMAMVLLSSASIGYYLVILWFTGLATGLVIGIVSAEITKRLPDLKL